MRLRKEIILNADPKAVWRFFDDPENARRWQPDLKSQTHRSGAPGGVGAVYELVHDHNGRDLTSVATVLQKREFETITCSIDSEYSFMTMTFCFEPAGSHRTRWILDTEIRFKGLYRIVAFFLRRSMHARADDEMRVAKQFLETGYYA